MTEAHRDALKDRLITSLLAAIVASVVPVAFALLTGLVSAPARLAAVERVLTEQVRDDSLQTVSLQRMDANIRWLTLVRCLDRTPRNPEECARFGDPSVQLRRP